MRRLQIATAPDANAFLTASYLPAHNERFAVSAASGLDAHTPLRPGTVLADVFALETPRTLTNDWVVRYHNRVLQVTPTRAAQRQVAPGRQVLVRESEAGAVRVVVCDPHTGREHALAWTLIVAAPPRAAVRPSPSPPSRPMAIAGYTRKGQPLSAKQLAARAGWDRQFATEQRRREGLRRYRAQRQAAGTASVTPE